MTTALRAVRAAARAEALELRRSPALLVLLVAQALVLLLLVLLFALNGSRAPVAVVDADATPASSAFITELARCHHSFSLTCTTTSEAARLLAGSRILAVITIPAGFARTLQEGGQAQLAVAIDNVDADLSEDIRRALPSAVVAFGLARDASRISLRLHEVDAIDHDTGFLPYLAVSGLVLDALALAGALAALTAARDSELGIRSQLALSPSGPLWPLLGRLATALAAAAVCLVAPLLMVVVLAGVRPLHAGALVLGLALCLMVGAALGAATGLLIRRSVPAAALVLGAVFALYLDSGAIEPQRFDGEAIWWLAHSSPAYPLVGLLEAAAHGLQVTPEPLGVDLLLALAWLALGAGTTRWLLLRFPGLAGQAGHAGPPGMRG